MQRVTRTYPNIACETYCAQGFYDIPTEIDLPPVPAETRRGRIRMVVFVPILSPCCELKRPEPPDVPAGIDTVCESPLQVKQAVNERLHMQDVDKPNRTNPEQARPAEQEVAKTDGDEDERDLKLVPRHVSRPHDIGTPLPHRGRFPLIQPPQMCPPETAVPRAGHVVNGVCVCMMITMICDPRARRARSVEYCGEHKQLLDNGIQLNRPVGKCAVVCDGCSECAYTGKDQRGHKDLPARNRE